MSSTIKNLYGSSNQTITAPSAVNSLANGGQVAYPAVDNTTDLFLDALVVVKAKTGASGTASNGIVNIYAAGTADGGTTYSDGITPNGSVTLTSNPNVRLIGSLNCVANATTYTSTPMSVAAAFGGILPDHWVIIIENKTGGSLDGSAGSSAFYQGLQNQVV